jgi:phage gp29-like protein
MRRSGIATTAANRRPANADLGRILMPSAIGLWRGAGLDYYTPQQVENILRYGLSGDLIGQWELFDAMEDTWPRLAKNLSEIKRAVTAMKWTVTPWAEDDDAPTPEAEARAKLVSHVLWRMTPDPADDERDFTGLIYDILDAWGKGLSVEELIWEERESVSVGDHFALRAAKWVHPQYYGFGQDGRLGLRSDGTMAPWISANPNSTIEFPPRKFLVGASKGRTAHMSAVAMLRPLAWWWAATNFGASWLLNYAQIFGIPLRWANYSPSASEQTIVKLGEALSQMGSAGYVMMPEGTALQIVEASKTAGTSPQEAILDRADKYCDLLVLGQTLTTDAADRGTQALGSVHERVRGDVLTAAADWASGIVNQQLIPAILELNYGDCDLAPEISAEPVRVQDAMANAQRDAVLLGAGIKLPLKWAYDRHEIPLPKEGEEVIGGPVAVPGTDDPAKTPKDASDEPRGMRTPPDPQKTTAEEPPRARIDSDKTAADAAAGSEPDPAEKIAAKRAEVLGKAYRGAMAPFRAAILASSGPDDAMKRLRSVYLDWPVERLAAEIESAFQLCAAAGVADMRRGGSMAQ